MVDRPPEQPAQQRSTEPPSKHPQQSATPSSASHHADAPASTPADPASFEKALSQAAASGNTQLRLILMDTRVVSITDDLITLDAQPQVVSLVRTKLDEIQKLCSSIAGKPVKAILAEPQPIKEPKPHNTSDPALDTSSTHTSEASDAMTGNPPSESNAPSFPASPTEPVVQADTPLIRLAIELFSDDALKNKNEHS